MKFTRMLAFSIVAAFGPAMAAAACSHHTDPVPPVVDPKDPCTNGTYVLDDETKTNAFTDEACRAFLDAEKTVVTDKTKAPTFTAPTVGQKLPAAPPAKFAWTTGTLSLSSPVWRRVLHELHPLKEAFAHGSTTGNGYVLEFKDKTGKEVLRVMTTDVEYTPDDKAWATLKAAGTLTVTLIGARFSANVIATGSKPIAGDPLAFTVGI